MKKINIYDGFTFVTGLLLNNMKGYYTVGRGENDYRADFYGLKSNEGINFKRLISQLKTKQNFKLIYQEYRGEIIKERKAISRYGVVETGKVINKTVPFTYINEYKQQIETSINCGINKKEDFILNVPHFNLEIDIRAKIIVCGIAYFYYDTEQYRKPVKKTAKKDDFYINDKYIAIKFFSENINDMVFLTQEVYGSSDWYKNNVNEIYIPLLENSNSTDELIWLYENAPDFTLAALNQEILWKHIKNFYNYDTAGKLSFIKDASTQLMRALFAFNTPEKIKYLMEQLHKNQNFVKKIYDALDGTISFMGQEQKCQTVFASIMASFCFTDISTLNFTNEIFYVGKDYYIDVEDIESNDKEKNKYWVEQHYKNKTSYVDTGTSIVEMGGEHFLMNRLKMNPLDIVTLLQKDTNSLLYVPIIFLKDIDHQKDIENLLTAVRIGVDMLAIGLTIATLGGASPLLAVVGALEITLNATDILVQVEKDALGKDFLEKWNTIYTIGGIATASPVAVAGLYKLGGAILASSVKAEIKNFVQSCMMKMVLESEISGFTKTTLKVANAETIEKATRYAFSKYSFENFWKEGCQIVYGEVKVGTRTETQIAFLYKGIAVAKGTERELAPFLTKLNGLRHNKNAFIEILENLYKITPKLDETKKYWTCFNEVGAELRWGSQSAKNIEIAIKSAKNNSNLGRQWEGEVAEAFVEIGEVKQVGTKIGYRNSRMTKFGPAGDYDVLTEKYLVECKESVSKNIDSDFLKQFDKYLNPKNEMYVNIGNRKVVLAIKNFKDNALNLSHPVLQELKSKGVIIITDLKQIKNLK